MLKRLPIVAAAACIVGVTASAESIAFPRYQNLISHHHTLAVPSKPFPGADSIPGDLGKAFASRDRLLPTVPGSGVRSNGASDATFAHSLNSGLILTYCGSGPSIAVKQRSVLYPILRSLFHHLPHASRRKEQ